MGFSDFVYDPTYLTLALDFNHPRSLILGLMSSMYSLGAVVALPFVPLVTDGIGRRWTIIASSVIMVAGAVIQATAHNCACLVRLILEA